MKILLYGGHFDPITTAHSAIALCALECTDYNQVWFLPSYKKVWPHKDISAPPQDRIIMINSTIYNSDLKCCNFEINKRLETGTFRTIQNIKNGYRRYDRSFGILIGADNANEFKKWKNWEELYTSTRFVIMPRIGVELNDPFFWIRQGRNIIIPKKVFKQLTGMTRNISSTMARQEIAEKGKRTKLVAKEVLNYILERRLYQSNKHK